MERVIHSKPCHGVKILSQLSSNVIPGVTAKTSLSCCAVLSYSCVNTPCLGPKHVADFENRTGKMLRKIGNRAKTKTMETYIITQNKPR